MIKATRNQLGNVSNPWQGRAKKVLCVCSACLLRSPTAANVLHKKFGFNTRACGTAKEFALIPISEALLYWADLVVFVNQENYDNLSEEERALIKDSVILDIPDNFTYGDSDLEDEVVDQLQRALEQRRVDAEG